MLHRPEATFPGGGLGGLTQVGCVVQRQSIGLWPVSFRCPALDLQLMGDHLSVSHPLLSQPTRPTQAQPFIVSGSINE